MNSLNSIRLFLKNVSFSIIIDKSMAWGFYISTVSSVIAVMWITNTFEKLGINMPVGFGEVLFYSIIALNLIIFTALTRLFWE